MTEAPVRALVLSGGGAAGAYEAGVAMALAEREPFDIVLGSSIGAINAAFIAQDRHGELERLWRNVARGGTFRVGPKLARVKHLAQDVAMFGSGNGLARIRTILHAIGDYASLRGPARGALPALAETTYLAKTLGGFVDHASLRRSLIVTATNVTRGRTTVLYSFAHRNGSRGDDGAAPPARRGRDLEWTPLSPTNFAHAIAASAALPGLFAPAEVDLDGTGPCLYADGGLAHNTPIGLAIAAGATDVTVVLVDPPDGPNCSRALGSIGWAACTIFGILQQRILEGELRLVEAVNETIRLGGAPNKRIVHLHQIRPARALPVGVMGFDDQQNIDEAFDLGVSDGRLGASELGPHR